MRFLKILTYIFSYFHSFDKYFFIPLVENFDALETIEQVFLQALQVNAFVRSLSFFSDSFELILIPINLIMSPMLIIRFLCSRRQTLHEFLGSLFAPSSLHRMGDFVRLLQTTADEWRFIGGTL